MKKLDENAVSNMFTGYVSKAQDLLRDPKKVEETVTKAIEKASGNKGPLDEIWYDLQLMFNMVKDWVHRNYKDVPVGSIAAILGGLLYFLSPIDFIPDFIPVAGLIDDVFVLGIVLKQVRADLRKYEEWTLKEAE